MNNVVVRLQNVTKTFMTESESLQILSNINLEVFESTKTVIIGESGSGKSTLLNIIGGLDQASSGSVFAGSYQIDALHEKALGEYRSTFLGLVFQFHYLLKDFTALENVMLPAFMAGVKRKEAIDRARHLLHEVNLDNRISHFPSQMSGGERQRVAVARALVNNPSLVLADEPTGNLDPSNADMVRDLLFSVVSSHNKTLILVTHDRLIASLADTCYELKLGCLEKL